MSKLGELWTPARPCLFLFGTFIMVRLIMGLFTAIEIFNTEKARVFNLCTLRTRKVVCFDQQRFSKWRTHASCIEHNSSIWSVVAMATDHVLSASADGTIGLHGSSTN